MMSPRMMVLMLLPRPLMLLVANDEGSSAGQSE
jgi:hypothetical protein